MPFAEYLAKIVSGAESVALDEGYVAELVALQARAPVSSERGAEYFDIAEGWSEDYGFGWGRCSGGSERGRGVSDEPPELAFFGIGQVSRSENGA